MKSSQTNGIDAIKSMLADGLGEIVLFATLKGSMDKPDNDFGPKRAQWCRDRLHSYGYPVFSVMEERKLASALRRPA